MTGSKSFDEKRLLELLAEGSEFAFIQIFDRYRKPIYLSAYKFLQVKEQAEEIVQEVFLEVWMKREGMRRVNNLQAYLYTMARNLVFDSYRNQKYSLLSTTLTEFNHLVHFDNATERNITEREYEGILTKAINQLPDQQRVIFKMAKEEGLSQEAIGEKLSLTRLAVKAHMKRALLFLRGKIEPHLK